MSDDQNSVAPIYLHSETLPSIYAKAWPERPGVSYLIEQFHSRIAGHGTYFSELVCLQCASATLPVLCSEAIHGPTLQEVFDNEPDRLTKLEPQHYSELLFVALLTNPEDGLPINYIVKNVGNGRDSFVSIDHDHAFFPDWLQDKNSGALTLQMKTILFCLDQMQQQINSAARERFLHLDARRTIEAIFRDAQAQDALYTKLFPSETICQWQKLSTKHCFVPISLKKGDAFAVYSRWLRLHRLLKCNPNLTGLDCLLQLHPKVGVAYSNALKQYTTPIQRLADLGRYKVNEHGVLTSNTRALYHVTTGVESRETTLGATYWGLEDLTPEAALKEINSLGYNHQELDTICSEVSAGNFRVFEELESLGHQSIVLKGDPESGLPHLNWGIFSNEQQCKLLQIVKARPFRDLSLYGCNSFF
ncbi:hypothetical protein RFI_22221 [Reticulomyxa filosa]|uniref:Uncharacterized protein n=1 Tax=Reticulomyxa filosa TaxID=46433 RepID=X6MMQ1_RETFI|nr:hypothetical protein RFI_22221 [Reticulomyxa filosa]|eukprot:ETO15144.1 hypothetical protein RFI_22221 [Reticulomyxa filosa]